MNIRDAGLADAPALWSVSKESGYPVPELAHDERQIRLMIERKKVVLIAEEGGEAVGFAALNPRSGELYSIEVRRDWHNKGIGTKLLEAVMEKAKALGFSEMWLYCHPRNTAALKFYADNGFYRKAMAPDHYSTGEPSVVMAKAQ